MPFDLRVRDDASRRDLLRMVTAAGRLLSTGVDRLRADGTCPAWGTRPTPAGFAALGVNEMLMRTIDITAGLGIAWHPPESLCAAVLARLFPDAPGGDPVRVLLWSTGRGDLPGHDRVASWIMKAAIE